MAQPVEALLFDLGKVILDIDMSRIPRHWALAAGLPAERVHAQAAAQLMGSTAFQAHERGEISDAAFFAHVREALGLELTDAQLLAGWNDIFLGEMAGIRDVLADLSGRWPLYVFSNTNAAHAAHWSAAYADLLTPFTKLYTSHELGRRKPEPDAFRTIVADLRVTPERILFFDDVAENVLGARACGLQAEQVTCTADIRRTLASVGLLAPHQAG